MQLSEQEVVRREKLSKLRALGINPYPADLFPVSHNSKQIKESFAEDKQVVIAGRLVSINIQGKASFAQLQDAEGRIQVYFNRDIILSYIVIASIIIILFIVGCVFISFLNNYNEKYCG